MFNRQATPAWWSQLLRNSDSDEQFEHTGQALVACEAAHCSAGSSSERLAGLDALRAFAMFLGIVLHACIAYSPTQLQSLIWPVTDRSVSRVCEALFWWIHAFRLPLFFFLAGYFSERLVQLRGVRQFAKQRAIRILIPYYVGLATVLPVVLVIWTWGWSLSGQAEFLSILSPYVSFTSEIQDHFFGPGHLWFLMDLSIITLAFVVLRSCWNPGVPGPTIAVTWLPKRLHPLLLMIVTAIQLWDEMSLFLSHHNSFVPHLVRMAYYGFFFFVGVELFRRPALLHQLTSFPKFHLSVACVSAVGVIALAPMAARSELGEWGIIGLALSVACTAWFMLFGFVGVALTHRWPVSLSRYSADAAYWMYLCHLPLVGGLQISLLSVDLAPEVKAALVTSATSLIALVTYHVLIRYTGIGAILHGVRHRPETKLVQPSSAPARSQTIPDPHIIAPMRNRNQMATDSSQQHLSDSLDQRQ